MRIEIDLTTMHRREALKFIDAAVAKGATIEDLQDLIHNLIYQKGSHTRSMRDILETGRDYTLARKEVNRCYLNMDDADALVAHCQKLIKQMVAQQTPAKNYFIDIVNVELKEDLASQCYAAIMGAVASGKMGEKELMQIIKDIKSQKSQLTMKDKTFYDRMALANQIVAFCEKQIELLKNPFAFDGIKTPAETPLKIKR